MTATFGELTAVARAHLEAARRQNLDATTATQHTAITHALDGCIRSVTRLVAAPPHRPPQADPDPARRRADAVLRANLNRAGQLLRGTLPGIPPEDPARAHPVAAHLVLAGSAIGASRDLLETHTLWTAAGPRDRSPLAAQIDTPQARRELAVTAAGYADQLASVASALASRVREPTPGAAAVVRDAARHLAAAATTGGERAAAGSRTPGMLDGVPALPPLRLDPVQPRETPRDLLARAVAGAERLHLAAFREVTAGRPDRHTAGAFATTAMAMATSHMATARILDGLLAATDWQPPEAVTLDADQLRKAVAAAETAFHAWLAARDGWRDIRVAASGTASHALRAEATALATRMGRLTYTDLTWTPRPGASHTPRPIEQLAADGEQLRALLDGLQQLTAASSRIAVEHSRMIDTLANGRQLLVRRRTLPEGVDIPRTWTPAAARTTLPLRAAYAEAGVAAADSCQALRQVMDTLHAERGRTMQPTPPVEHQATAHDLPPRSRQAPTHPTLREPMGPAGRVIDL